MVFILSTAWAHLWLVTISGRTLVLGLLKLNLTPNRSSLYAAPWLSRILMEQQSNFPDSQYL